MATLETRKKQSSPARPRFGYRHGLSQPSTTLTFAIEMPSKEWNPALVDKTLQEAFEVKGRLLPDGDSFQGRERQAADMAWRTLLLGSTLLQVLKIPSFDPGKILAITAAQPRGNTYRVMVAIPVFEHVPKDVLEKAYSTAFRTLTAMASGLSKGESPRPLVDRVNREFVSPMYTAISGGRSTIPLLATAYRAGIPFRHVYGGTYQLGWGCNAVLLDRSSIETDSAIGARLSNNKFAAAAILRAAGLPAPQHRRVATESEAWTAAQRLGLPVVVKPPDRDRGEGVTVDVNRRSDLADAFARASGFSKTVLVERQVKGVCHRLYVSRGKLLFAVKRLPKSVTGDGIHSVAELIERANARELASPPWSRLKPFPRDAMAIENLAAAGLSLDSIPAAGQYAPLRRIQSTEWGGVVEEVTGILHPENMDIAVRAATQFGLASAGIDLISEDITVPWYRNGAIINEVNYSPLLTDEAIAASYLPKMIGGAVKGDGRIPIEVFIGGAQAFEQGRKRQRELVGKGVQCVLTSHDRTLEPSGQERVFSVQSLFERCRMLLMDRGVDGMVMVIQQDELVATGLPVDRIGGITLVDAELDAWQDPGNPAPAASHEALRQLLYAYSL